MSVLNVFETQEESLELILPRECPIHTSSHGMDRFIEQTLSYPLHVLLMARILLDVGDHACIEHALAMVRGIKASIEIQRGSSKLQTDRLGHPLQGFETLRQQHHVRRMDGRHREWRPHIAMVVRDGNDLLALLVFVTRVPNTVSPFLATVLVPSPWSIRTSSFFSSERWATRAMNACWSDPSSAHVANARYTVVSCMSDLPVGPFGMGKHFHGIPVYSTHNMTFKRR
jgi:hypothetical protein